MEEQNTNGNGYFKGNIDARVSALEENVKSIMTNHLPHIQDSVNKLALDIERRQEKMNKWLIGILVSLILILASVVANKAA